MDCKSIICDANAHYEAYLKTIKGSKWKETTQKFALNYLRNIFKLIDELSKQIYKPGEEGEFTLNERGKILYLFLILLHNCLTPPCLYLIVLENFQTEHL